MQQVAGDPNNHAQFDMVHDASVVMIISGGEGFSSRRMAVMLGALGNRIPSIEEGVENTVANQRMSVR
jgi:hypothetical protein